MVFLVELTHRGTGGWNDIVDKEKEGILSSKMNSLPNQEVELTNCEIRRHQVFLFVQISYPSFGSLFYYHRDPVRVFLSDLLALRATLLERMLLFIYELHPPGNQVGPGWAEGTRGGGGPGLGAVATAATRGRIQRSDPRTCATSVFTNPALAHQGPPLLLHYSTSATALTATTRHTVSVIALESTRGLRRRRSKGSWLLLPSKITENSFFDFPPQSWG